MLPGELHVSQEYREGIKSLYTVQGPRDEKFIHLDAEAVVLTAAYMLIDLSDTNNWPHSKTGHIDVLGWDIDVNPATAFRGDIELGFLSDVDPDNGNFHILHTWHFDQASAPIDSDARFSHLEARLNSWFGPTSADDVLFQTDTNLQGPNGVVSFPSGDGDLVLKITRTAGAVDVGVTIFYQTRD